MAISVEHNIFPDLTPRAEIFQKAGLIEKVYLEQATLRFPENLASMIEGLQFFRVLGIQASFDATGEKILPRQMDSGFFAAMYNLGLPLVYAINCSNEQVRIFLGTAKATASSLAALLEGNLGSELFEINNEVRALNLQAAQHCAAVTGIPSDPQPKQRPDMGQRTEGAGSGLDRLISGLLGDDWTYLVQSFPLRRNLTSSWFESCAAEIKDIKESFLLRDIQQSHRMASYYVELLEKSLNRLKYGKQQGMWQTGIYLIANQPDTARRGAALLTSIYSGEKSAPEPLRCHLCSKSSGLPSFVNGYHSRELQSFVSFPVKEYPGFRIHEVTPFDVDFKNDGRQSIEIGRIITNGRVLNKEVSIPVDDLTKHALVAGVTGSGKTNTVLNLLVKLYSSGKVPFLVIEPAKSEYRNLIEKIDSLLVFTLGEERPGQSSPFRFNPFAFPEGVSLQTHVDYLKAVFNASFVMYAPMPYVLEDCLYRIYEDKGWNLVTSSNSRGRHELSFPTLEDLYYKIDDVVQDLGYQDRTSMDIKAALKTRIRNLCLGGKGLMLNTAFTLPFSEIMARPTVLELKYIGNDEEKTFMMGLIITAIGEYYESQYTRRNDRSPGLKHLTVIEEAHRLLKNVPTEKTSEDQSNVKGKAVETFSNLLAEIRAYGEGVLVAEQIPSKLAQDVVKNTSLKLMHRLVAREDRDLMGDTMNLDQAQKRHAVSLSAGRAICFSEGMDRALAIRVLPWQAGDKLVVIGNDRVHKEMHRRFYSRHQELLLRSSACRHCALLGKPDCENTRKAVEQLTANGNARDLALRCFLPYLIDPERTRSLEHLQSIVHAPLSLLHCLAADLTQEYIRARAAHFGWPFAVMEELTSKAHNAIAGGSFGRIIGLHCRVAEAESGRKYKACEIYCHNPCRFGYEVSVLAGEARVHNEVTALLESREHGIPFFLNLVTLIIDFLRDYLPEDQSASRAGLATCYLIHKINEHRFALPLQSKVLKEYERALEGID